LGAAAGAGAYPGIGKPLGLCSELHAESFLPVAIHSITAHQTIPASLEAVWAFFSSAKNLQAITPAYMRFQILNETDLPPEIYPGLVIRYRVSPVLRVPLFWMTEITAVERLRRFVDEQRRGPYKLWHHQHLFEEVPGGVRMTDTVHYELPLGPLGSLAHALFVRRQLDEIFSYRFKKVEETFGRSGS